MLFVKENDKKSDRIPSQCFRRACGFERHTISCVAQGHATISTHSELKCLLQQIWRGHHHHKALSMQARVGHKPQVSGASLTWYDDVNEALTFDNGSVSSGTWLLPQVNLNR